MRKIIQLTVLLITDSMLFAQNQREILDQRPLNSLSFNIAGDASLISLNYDRQFVVKSNFIISSKLGIGYNEEFRLCLFNECSSPTNKFLTIPQHITANIGERNHFTEFGLGGTILIGNPSQQYLLYTIIGYRGMPLKKNKTNFRVYLQIPLFEFKKVDILFLPFGFSIGKSF